jgi:hypothetical protein
LIDHVRSTLSTPARPQKLQLSKSQIAFIGALIEYLREEETGRSESVTISLDEERGCEPLLAVCDHKFVIQAFGSFLSFLAPEQKEILEQFCSDLRRHSSLDELVELRDLLEGRKPKSKRG